MTDGGRSPAAADGAGPGGGAPRRLLVVDLDGTLLGPDRTIAAADAAALRRAAAAGTTLCVATGRGQHTARPVLAQLPVPAYAALHNGALMLDPRGAELWRTAMHPAAVAAAVPLVRAAGLHPMLYARPRPGVPAPATAGTAGTAGGQPDLVLVLEPAARRSPYTQAYLRTKQPILELTGDVLGARHRGVLGLVSFGARSAAAAAAAALRPLRGRLSSWWSTPLHDAAYLLEAVAPRGTKRGAVARLTRALGLTRDRVTAIGDNSNDLELLNYAGVGIAMANATPDVRAAADFVTASNAEAGVARALAWLESQR